VGSGGVRSTREGDFVTPTVTLLLTCSDGHQVEMFPEKVLQSRHDDAGWGLTDDYVVAEWSCPRCISGTTIEVRL
jgi:hypothetical protein